MSDADVSSNDPNAPDSGNDDWATHESDAIGHILNLDKFYYYVQINLIRADHDVPLGAMGVSLLK